ncbi:hypothetical protein E4P82_07475 [Candidatus Competibacter phosphatis]|uniref:Uncharacterized protein n=1 Tax=Candidatus Competibacter phosphatis TaxID=221280 RepID=A0ABX1TK76_9GAMM|nr:hypothetical protein [Candidatus Competibacter phosphatis]MDG4559915.1 hypothetical protein [Candidatus Competibacter sp.]NMQ19059.1 hypothetical protein [Candidatus Competibacter phosphatis]
MQVPRLVMFHIQSTSARTRFLMLNHGSICAFGGLPSLSKLVEVSEKTHETVAHHPASVIGRAERELGLVAGSLVNERDFRAKVNTPDGLIEVFLARFNSIDPPFEWAAEHGAKFIDITQARGLPTVELQILRRAYEQILG